jgi:hypothetical protein
MKRVADRTDVNVDTLERELAAPEGRARTLAYQQGPKQRPRARNTGNAGRAPYHARLGEAERLLVLLMARDPAWIGAAVAEVRPQELRDPVYRELFEAMANAATENGTVTTTPAEAILAEVSEPAREAFLALHQDTMEIADGERTFRDVVADIRAVPLFLRLQDIDRQLESAAEGDEPMLLSERRQVNEALGALDARGFKFSPRYRRHARAVRPGKRTPSTEDV